MYNNIKKFVNPKYATLFLFCITVLLIIIFMKTRKEPLSNKEEKEVNKLIDKRIVDKTDTVNTAIQDTAIIKDIQDTKASKTELASYAKQSDLASGLGSKLNTSEFGTKLTQDSTIRGLQTGVSSLNTDVGGLKTGMFALNTTMDGVETSVSRLKTNVSDLNTGKLDTSVYQSDMKSIPTMNNISDAIGSRVDSKIEEKVGTIQNAKGDYEKAYSDFTKNASTLKTDFNTNAGNLKADFNTFASNLAGGYNSNAYEQTAAFNRNYYDKYGTIKDMKIAAEIAKAGAIAAKTEAVNAQIESKKIYDDVFGEVSGRVITQANTYRSGLSLNPDSGIYDSTVSPNTGANNSTVIPITGANNSTVNGNSSAINSTVGLGFGVINGNSSVIGSSVGLDFGVINGNSSVIGSSKNIEEKFSTIEGMASDAIFTLEQKVITDINNFNSAYYALISCKKDSKLCGAQLPVLEGNLTESNSRLLASIDELKTEYAKHTETDGTQALLDNAARVTQLRQDLDKKMARIIDSKNTPNEMSRHLDSTVYAGILWSVLGTSLLYYIFTE